jgi:hypothetical protein
MQRYEECQVYALWRTFLQGRGNFRLNDYGFHCNTLIVFLKPFKWNITFCQQHYPCIHSLPICWRLSRTASSNFPEWTDGWMMNEWREKKWSLRMNIKAQGSLFFAGLLLKMHQNAIYNWDIYWRFWDLLKKNLIWVVPIMLPVHRNQTRQQMMCSSILDSDVHHQISWHHWLACQSLHGCGSRFPNLPLEEKGNKRQTELDWGGEGEGTTLDIVFPTTGPFGSGDCLVRTVLLAKTHPHVHFTSFASIVIWCI